MGAPRLLGYVEKAELARIQHDVKVMEQEMKLALIDEEAEIAKWGNNKKNLGALIMQDKLFEKEGVAERLSADHLTKDGTLDLSKFVANSKVNNDDLGEGGNLILSMDEDTYEIEDFSIDKTYKIIPDKYKGDIGTKLGGTFYTNDLGKVYYEHDKPIEGNEKDKILDCPLPLPDYDFEPETGTIVKWYGTETHLIIPEAFKVEINEEEQCVPVRIIGKAAFMRGGFKSIVIPQSVRRIEGSAFEDNKLTKVVIPHSVEYIDPTAFNNNFSSNMGGEIIIRNTPEEVEIGGNYLDGVKPKYVPITPKELGIVFNPSSGRIISGGQPKDKSIVIPKFFVIDGEEKPVKQIDKGAYQGLGLISVVLPEGLERIEDYAFAGNQLEGVVMPDKVNHVGNYAFAFNEAIHSKTGQKKATIEFIQIKGDDYFKYVNRHGDIAQNGLKIDVLKGEVRLLKHIFVTSIDNHVIDEEYVGKNDLISNDNVSDVKGPLREPLEDEVVIKTAEDLNNIRNDLQGKYILMADIDLSAYQEDEGWEPIGHTRSSDSFRGKLDGNGFKITGLTINRPDENRVGLFGGYLNNATITNVALENVEIIGRGNVGGIAGEILNSVEILNSYVTGNVSGYNNVGGLVGCTRTGADYNSKVYINNSYFIGSVLSESNYAGGLTSRTSEYVYISNCYSKGSVDGKQYVGGLVGWQGSNISNSYSISTVSGTKDVGSVIGNQYSHPDKTFNLYWNTDKSNISSGVGTGNPFDHGVYGVTDEQMKQKSTFTENHWDFLNVWTINEGESYPTLRSNPER